MIFQITWLVSEWKSSLATYIKADRVKQQRPPKKEETDFVTEADPTQTGVAHRYRTFVDGILKYNMIVNTLFLSNILVVDYVKRIYLRFVKRICRGIQRTDIFNWHTKPHAN